MCKMRRFGEGSEDMPKDDCILFGKVTITGANVIKGILKEYEESSGMNASCHVKQLASQMLNVRMSTEPEKYLGLPNISILHLSQEGKSVLQAIPTYSMLCFPLPNTLCVELENIIGNFWWRTINVVFIGVIGNDYVI
ncbi:reverse transcriptase [Gossypium australe]|uniref:Reverse transcriptase n=1 Tax=Gossypium australe TaxID=47621 RepID=A0A5B6X1Y3_9ROSI|nr:reverse transcriptase [Gossypium australe]